MKRAQTEQNLIPRHAPDGVVMDGAVRVGPYMTVPALLRERGIDPAPLLAEFGLGSAHFLDPENTIALGDAGRLFARCAQITGCPHFALLDPPSPCESAIRASARPAH